MFISYGYGDSVSGVRIDEGLAELFSGEFYVCASLSSLVFACAADALYRNSFAERIFKKDAS